MTSTIFDVQCSENFRNINVGINNNNSELQVYHKNSGIVYKTKVNIWNPLLGYDNWINYYFRNCNTKANRANSNSESSIRGPCFIFFSIYNFRLFFYPT